MDRRAFLKLIGAITAAIGAITMWPAAVFGATGAPVAYAGKLYKPGRKGRILVSSNGGQTWKLQTNLGSKYRVRSLAVDASNHLRSTVAYGTRSFSLTLGPDLKRWYVN